MATIAQALGGTAGHPSRSSVKQPYVISNTLNWAEVLTAKGSALAANDVVTALNVPAGTLVLHAGIEVVTAADATAATVDLGDGDDADGYVDGANAKTVAFASSTLALTEGTPNTVTGYRSGKVYGTADTIDLTVATLTGTLAAGVVRVWAVVMDVA